MRDDQFKHIRLIRCRTKGSAGDQLMKQIRILYYIEIEFILSSLFTCEGMIFAKKIKIHVM